MTASTASTLGLTSVTPGSGGTTAQIIYFLMFWGKERITSCLNSTTVMPRSREVHSKMRKMDVGLSRGGSSGLLHKNNNRQQSDIYTDFQFLPLTL